MTCTDYCSVFDCCLQEEALCGIREVSSVQEDQPVHHDTAREGETEPEERSVSDRMVCSACRWPFDTRDDQLEHYKLDWHRFNLRLKMAGLGPVTADEFETKTGTGDMSSISGSESESEEEEEEEDSDWTRKSSDVITHTDKEDPSDSLPGRFSSKVVFQNSEGQYLAVYRCALHGKSDDEGDSAASLKAISSKTVWVVLMTGGGHFAGAVFKGKEVLQHKTFHRYTVRAKRGTAQGLKDAQNRGHAPKSAGAALRRHNEAALVKEIQDLLESWAEHLQEASGIFLRAPSYNRTTFFGGRAAPLDKKDPRIHTLPFPTRRATFKEIKRVHHVLSTVHVYGKETEVSTILSPSKKVWKKAAKPTPPNPDPETNDDGCDDDDDGSSEEDCGSQQLETVEMSLGTLDLREHEIYPSRQRKRRRRKKEGNKMENKGVNTGEENKLEGDLAGLEGDLAEREGYLAELEGDEAPQTEVILQEKPQKTKGRRKPPSKKNQPEEEEAEDEAWEYGMRDALYTACKTGDVDSLHSLLLILPEETGGGGGVEGEKGEGSGRTQHLQPPGVSLGPLALLNKPIDSSGFTLLHVASAAAQKAVVLLLMDAGADPAVRDSKGQTAYIVAPEKDTRNAFRKYMAEHPEKYDYSKAQVPGPLTAEIESKKTEKKKAQKVAKKQRGREQKEEKKKIELEAEEKKRFAALSDREKRALAAERRLADQVAATGVNISNIQRCWQCGESLQGKIPFQYLHFSFCSPPCVQTHRKANAAAPR